MKERMKKNIITLVAISLSLSGCGIYTKYEPATVVPDDLYGGEVVTEDTAGLGNMDWRELFTDPYLQSLIEVGLQTNTDYQSAQRVPTPTGSTTILNAVVKGKVTVDEVNAQMKSEATESFGYNTDEIVSSDVIGIRYGSLFDATQTMVTKLDDDTYQVQVVSWYDNENSYTSQMVRTIKYFAELA